MLYDHFKNKFLMKLKTFGRQRLELERKRMREASNEMRQKCRDGYSDPICDNLQKGENQFLDELRQRQTIKSNKLLKSRMNYSTAKDS